MRRRHRAHPALPAMKPRTDIQGLRAVAVLLVVLAHAGVPGVTGGYIGVDVFFVLSGYLITSILLHEATERGSVSLVGFYGKRARRILPAATLTLVTTALAATVLLPYVRADIILRDVVWAALFASNVRSGQQSTDYFTSDQPASPVQHYWSLAVEEQFYLVWPAVIVVVLVVGARRRPAAVRRRVPLLGLVVSVLAAASLVWSVIETQANPSSAYFSTGARCWELGAGALLAFAGRSLPKLTRRMRSLLAVTGLGMVLSAAVVFTEHTPVPGYHIALPVLGTVALIAAGSGDPQSPPLIARLLGRQPLRWIGDVSYGFYLWHWPFLILAEAYAGRELALSTNLALCGGALVVAWLSYHLLENPIRRARTLSHRPRFALLLWPVAIGSLLVVNIGSQAYITYEQRIVAQAAANVDLSTLPPSQRVPRTGDPVHDALAEALDRASLAAPQAPQTDLTQASEEWVRDPSCRAAETESSHGICPIGDLGGDRTMVVLGDSHAQMWLPALEAIAERSGYELVPITKLGCTPYDVVAWKYSRAEEYTECNEWRTWAVDQIRLAEPDVVVVGSASVIKSVDASSGELFSLDESRPLWRDGARSLAEELLTVAPEVRFLEDINRLPWNPDDCLSDLDKTAADCTVEPSGWVADSNRLIRRGIAGSDAEHVGVSDLFCLDNRCPTVVDDMAVYGDDDHMTHEYAMFLADELQERLRLPTATDDDRR